VLRVQYHTAVYYVWHGNMRAGITMSGTVLPGTEFLDLRDEETFKCVQHVALSLEIRYTDLT